MTKLSSGKRITYHNTGAPTIVTFANGIITDYVSQQELGDAYKELYGGSR